MRWLRRVGRLLLGLTALLLLWYATAPVYDFPKPSPFAGKNWYNPFDADSLPWSRANFHIHSRTWGSLTNGDQDPPTIRRVYDSLGIAWTGISDYQRINSQSHIPLYEHGWSIGKVHQLCFWPKEVLWIDYPLWQSPSIKQYILARLRSTTPFLVVAHPRFLHSYTAEDMTLLGGYDAIEVLNRYGDSVEEWDSALSVGHYAPILAHDNAHNVYNPHQVMSRWTEVALPPAAPVDSLRFALLAGRTVGYKNRLPVPPTQPYPHFARITMRGDTLSVKLTMIVDSLRVIGQAGKVRLAAYQSDSLWYLASPTDTYLRLEAYTAAVEAYTSPLLRGEPLRRPIPPIHWPKTLFRSGLYGVLATLLAWIALRRRRLKEHKAPANPALSQKSVR